MSTRKLASIQVVDSLTPIPDRDRIELAGILGWQVIVQKGLSVGDKVVYVEIDSILPDRPEFAFLKDRCFSPKWNGMRIRTMKMGGQISQGIIFSFAALGYAPELAKLPVGTDVTEKLQIRKYDPELLAEQADAQSKKRGKLMRFLMRFKLMRKLLLPKPATGDWPDFLMKTDETRLQAVPEILHDYAHVPVVITEKYDGQSATYAIYKKQFYVLSRTMWRKKQEKNSWWDIALEYDIEKKLRALGGNIAVQGEIVGPNIQSNRYDLATRRFFVFSIFDIDKQEYIPMRNWPDLLLPRVPIVGGGSTQLGAFGSTVREWVDLAKGVSVLNPDVPREGIVVRSFDGNPRKVRGLGEQFSFKVINPDFLVKYDL